MIFLPMLLDVHSSIFKDCLAKVSFLARVTQLESPTPSLKKERRAAVFLILAKGGSDFSHKEDAVGKKGGLL